MEKGREKYFEENLILYTKRKTGKCPEITVVCQFNEMSCIVQNLYRCTC